MYPEARQDQAVELPYDRTRGDGLEPEPNYERSDMQDHHEPDGSKSIRMDMNPCSDCGCYLVRTRRADLGKRLGSVSSSLA